MMLNTVGASATRNNLETMTEGVDGFALDGVEGLALDSNLASNSFGVLALDPIHT